MKFMKCKLEPKERKLVAIIGSSGNCLYLPGLTPDTHSIQFDGVRTVHWPFSLQQILKDGGRTAVYEGNTIQIAF